MNITDKNIRFLEELLHPLLPYYDTIGLYGDRESSQGTDISWFEMFARSAYGICAYTAAVGDNVYVRKFNETIHKAINDERYASWQDGDQKAVELIPIISLLLIHRDITWNTYSAKEKNDLLAFFGHINAIQIGGDNWQFFRILVTRGIIEFGGNQDVKHIEDSWKVVDECYCGDGWYRDGKNGAKDYYVAFGYHYYSLLYRYLFPNDERCNTIRERALAFAKEYQYFFDAEGRMIVYGRSMIYRCASLAFWSMLLCNDDLLNDSLRAQTITIIDKSLDWWKRQPITDKDGLLTLGIAYRNECVCENYNSSGSPYWLMKAFAFMLADKDKLALSPTESSTEDSAPEIKTIANGDIMVVRNAKWNTAFINSYKGVGYVANNSAKYMRFAYNSLTGFNLSREANDFRNLSDDNSLVFDIAGVKHQREANHKYIPHDGYQEFEWRCGDLIKVRSCVIPQMNGYIRVHIVKSRLAVDCYETGFTVGAGDNAYGVMALLYGSGDVIEIANAVNSNIYHPHTAMQCVKYHISKGVNLISDYSWLGEEESNPIGTENVPIVRLANGKIIVETNQKIAIPLRSSELVAIRLSAIKNKAHTAYTTLSKKMLSVYNNTGWIKNCYRNIKRKLR